MRVMFSWCLYFNGKDVVDVEKGKAFGLQLSNVGFVGSGRVPSNKFC